MSSSEVVDSGRISGQKSNFSQTCSLLSQYLKERGTFGDIGLGISRGFDSNGGPATPTINLLTMMEKPGQNQGAPTRNSAVTPNSVNLFPQTKTSDLSVMKAEPEKAQMTIFYGGQVIVFNDFPADKAKELMLLASKSGGNNPNVFTTTQMAPKLTESATNLVSPATPIIPTFPTNQRPVQPIVSDLPIARKASLTRFLEKRKDRLTAKAPYQLNYSMGAAASKPDENKTWLGLGAQIPVKMEHQY